MSPTITHLTYFFLYLTSICLWVPQFKKIPIWTLLLSVSIFLGLVSERIDWIALPLIVLLGITTIFFGNVTVPTPIRVVSAVLLLILGIEFGLFGIHMLHSFNNLHVITNAHIGHHAVPYNLYLNFDKTLVGIFILGILHQRISTRKEWIVMFEDMIPKALLVITVIACLSLLLKFVWLDFKIPNFLWLWIPTNLLFVCLAEEAFFRGFIQKYLCLALQKYTYGNAISIGIASLLFGLSHFTGGSLYVLLSTIAGLGYGWIYFHTQRIEASIITHFSLNLVHVLLFTYPALVNYA